MDIEFDIPDNEKDGLFDLPKQDVCRDREHEPPGYIVIPHGMGYRHRCPSCGKVSVIIPRHPTL